MAREQKGKAGKVSREDIKQYQRERQSLERDLIDEVLKSRKVAWVLAGVATLITVGSLVVSGIVVERYWQPIPPYMLVVNGKTGVIRQVSIMDKPRDSYGERIDTYWVSQFVRYYERYDYYTLSRDYRAVNLMATQGVAQPYMEKYTGSDPKDERLGDSLTRSVHIRSVALSTKQNTATVRFTTQVKYRDRRLPEPEQHWVATIAYKYANFPMTSRQRRLNPLGFRVTSYRVQPVSIANDGG